MSGNPPLSSNNVPDESTSSYQRMEESGHANPIRPQQQQQLSSSQATSAGMSSPNFQPMEIQHDAQTRIHNNNNNYTLESHATQSSTGHQQTNSSWFTKNTRTHRAQAAAAAQAERTAAGYQGGRMPTDRHTHSPAAAAALNDGVSDAIYPQSSSASSSDYNTADSYESPPQQVERLMRPDVPYNNNNYAKPNQFKRISSWMSSASSVGTSSLADFDDSEWTPRDSSYGAAIPIAGWIPKNIRRLIEYSIMTVAAALFIYLVVAISIKIREQNDGISNNNSKDSSSLYLDDDMYIAYDDAVANATGAVDDDDNAYKAYHNYNNNNNNRRRRRRLRYASWLRNYYSEDEDDDRTTNTEARHGGEKDDWISFSQRWDDGTDDAYLP